LFAFEDVIQIVKTLVTEQKHEQAGRLLFLSGYANLMLDQIDSAIRDFNKSLNSLQASPSENILMAVYYWLTISFSIKGRETFARANQEQLEKLAIEFDNQRFYALSQFASYYINSKITQHFLVSSDLDSLKALLVKQNYKNLYCHVLLQVFSPVSEEFTSPKLLIKNCIVAMRLYRESKNRFGLSIALQAIGICNSRLGNNAQTNRLFILSLKLRETFQGQSNLTHMRNGLGYHCISLEKWLEAWNYLDAALESLIDSNNYTELSITLFNYAWLYGQSGNYLWAIEILDDLLQLMHSRGVDTLPFRNLKDVYAYKGWLHIQAKQPIQAQYSLVRFQKLPHLHNTAFSAVLEQLLKTSLALLNGKTNVAAKSLNKATRELGQSKDFDLYMLSTLELEIARFYKKMGYLDESKAIFDELRVRAQKLDYNALAQRISRASLGLALNELSPLPAIKRPYRLLMQLADKESRVIELQHELSDLHQANLLLELSTTEPSVKGFLSKAIEILDRRIPANHLMVLLSDSNLDFDDIQITNDSPEELVQLCSDYLKDKRDFQSLLSFDLGSETLMAWPLSMKACQGAWLIVSGDESQALVWNKDYILLVAQQLGLVLDRRFREIQLEQLTRTDMLTGILNRAGLFERMKKHFSHMKRFPDESFTLCYFDLDHFKYFNDQYGHELGDKVLKALTDLVYDNLRESDEFGRIGGDEFIILLPDADQKEAERILTRIRIEIAKATWWLPLLNLDKESENPISEENWITASFGAVVVHGWPKTGLSRKTLTGQADKLMYQAKTDGRNRICIHDYIDTKD
ncbi:GGDEF domain-containing protein, partial [Reinekea sp.]